MSLSGSTMSNDTLIAEKGSEGNKKREAGK